mmetsp:Transcript_8049/g.11680  ORF Transcript_8049/g.11680 Transcript_8049/m.11680 type:complete len:877 (-) Transcript_8049:46-2676(-)
MSCESSNVGSRCESSFSNNFTIKFPSTTKDNGSPSYDLMNDCNRVFALIDDERHITAQQLYTSIQKRMAGYSSKFHSPTKNGILRRRKNRKLVDAENEKFRAVEEFLATRRYQLQDLQEKAGIFERAKETLKESEDWTLSQNLFGVTTYYRHEDDESLSIKLEGVLDNAPIFEQIAVLREIDLYQDWAPFCSSSIVVKQLDKLDSVGWMIIGAPQLGLSRDSIFRAIGCDNMVEDGSVIICAQGLRDRPETEPFAEPFLAKSVDNLDYPEIPTGLGSGRLTIRNFSALITFHSATCFETKLVANINPNLPLPQYMIDFVMKKMCGVLLSKLQTAAKKASKDPVRCAHARKVRQEKEFYEAWLLPKFEAYCQTMKWEMPKVRALNLTDRQLEQEFEYKEQKRNNIFGTASVEESSDDNSTSSISRLTTGTINSRFPNVVRYLRDMDSKTEEKKARRIVAARKRAAKRLKPKEFNEQQKARLVELKEAKARRSRTRGLPGAVLEVEQIRAPYLYDHGRSLRFLITSALCFVLAVTLYPEFLFPDLVETLESREQNFLINLLFDAGSLTYICICAVVHFSVCDVAMLYAFCALDLGMKTGRQSKNYYNESVRMAVATMSGSVAAFSVVKAIITLSMRVMTWNLLLAIKWAPDFFTNASDWSKSYLPSVIITFVNRVQCSFYRLTASIIYHTVKILSFVLWLLRAVLLRSNRIGIFIEWIANFFIKAFLPSVRSRWRVYIEHVVSVYEDSEIVPTWRCDAVQTARFLLAYTAMFLLSVLILFNFFARVNKVRAEVYLRKTYSRSISGVEQNLRSADQADFQTDNVMQKANSHVSDDYSVSVDAEEQLNGTNSNTNQRRFKIRLKRKRKKRNRENHAPSPM